MKLSTLWASTLLLSTLSLAAVADTAVNISQFTFVPPTVAVPVGTKVIWTNQDKVNHSIISDTGIFSSNPLKLGDSFSYTFTTPGTYSYHCGYHSYMTGVITVK